jgi:hypothetical protein
MRLITTKHQTKINKVATLFHEDIHCFCSICLLLVTIRDKNGRKTPSPVPIFAFYHQKRDLARNSWEQKRDKWGVRK